MLIDLFFHINSLSLVGFVEACKEKPFVDVTENTTSELIDVLFSSA